MNPLPLTRPRSLLLAALAGALALALSEQPAHAATFTVNNTVACSDITGTPYCTIQAAVNAAAANGTGPDTVSVGPGTYNENVTLSEANLTLEGAVALTIGEAPNPAAHTIIDGTGLSGSGIRLNNNVTGVTIRNLRVQGFDGPAASGAASGIYGALSNSSLTIQDVHVYNNGISGTANGGILLNGPINGVTIARVDARNNFSRGIVIWNGFKQNISITDSWAQGNNCCGIELQDGTASGVTLTGNTAINNTDSGMSAVGLTSGAGPNLISGNTVTDNGRFGIEIKLPNGTGATGGDGSIVVENNTVTRTGAISDLRDTAGIVVMRRGWVSGNNNADIPTGVVVRNNTVSGYTQPSTSDGFGISVEGLNMVVTGNTVSGNDVGIQVQAGHLPYTPNTSIDGDQSNLADLYFGRGNSPLACVYEANPANSGNTVDFRQVGAWAFLADTANGSCAETLVVTELDWQDWLIGPDPGNSVNPAAGWEFGPGTPPLGDGSYYTDVPNSSTYSKQLLLVPASWIGQSLAALTTLSYSTYVDPASATLNNWYINLYIDRDNNGTFETRLDYVPGSFGNPAVVAGTWQTWDARGGTWYIAVGAGAGGTTTLPAFLTTYPNAKLYAFNSSYPPIVFNMGDTASTYQGFIGNLDNVTLALAGLAYTYDFEPLVIDLTIDKTDSPGGPYDTGVSWAWDLVITNDAASNTDAVFNGDEVVLTDDLPASGLTYGAITVTGSAGVTGADEVTCAIDGASTLTCTVNSGETLTLPPGETLTVSLEVTGDTAGDYDNPRTAGVCAVDTGAAVDEVDELNNDCADSVTITQPSPECGLLLNCSFEEDTDADLVPDFWEPGSLSVGPALNRDSIDTGTFTDGVQSMRFYNDGKLTQVVPVDGLAGDDITLTFDTRGTDVRSSGKYRVTVKLHYVGGGSNSYIINLPVGTNDWISYILPITAPRDYDSITVEIKFTKKGTVWFDNFLLEISPGVN